MTRLDQTYLMVANLEAATEFYRDVLELNMHEKGENSIEFDTGSCRLKLEHDFDQETLAMFGLDSPGSNRGDGVIIVLDVDDVDAIYERIMDSTTPAEVLAKPQDVSWGKRLCLVRDPEGYVLELSHPT